MEAVQKEMKLCLPTINSRLTFSFKKLRNRGQIPVQVWMSGMLSSSIKIDPENNPDLCSPQQFEVLTVMR
jgi:hypothetical protein